MDINKLSATDRWNARHFPADPLNLTEKQEAELALDRAIRLQGEFWDAIRDLEVALGHDRVPVEFNLDCDLTELDFDTEFGDRFTDAGELKDEYREEDNDNA